MPQWLASVVAAAPDALGTVSGWTAVMTLVTVAASAATGIAILVWRIAKAAAKIESTFELLTEKVADVASDVSKVRHDQRDDAQAISLLRAAVNHTRDDVEKLDERVRDLEMAK